MILYVYSVCEFTKKTVDPDSISKDPRYCENFKVEMHFKDVCTCKPTEPLDKLC
jgi:hypothetical protein